MKGMPIIPEETSWHVFKQIYWEHDECTFFFTFYKTRRLSIFEGLLNSTLNLSLTKKFFTGANLVWNIPCIIHTLCCKVSAKFS